MLLRGINHVATLTNDSARLRDFYQAVFDAEVPSDGPEVGSNEAVRLTIIKVGEFAELNVFEIDGNTEADRQVPMFGRGRLDHFALEAASLEAFDVVRSRLLERGACGEFVTDFRPVLSLFFRDPDGLEGEVTVQNPDAVPGIFHPPGTPAPRYVPRT